MFVVVQNGEVVLNKGYGVSNIETGSLIDPEVTLVRIILIGAHIDSHRLGTGAIDNGANASMMIDIARQIKRLGIVPKRTIRFGLWNGEEQAMLGSLAYAREQKASLDQHKLVISIDAGAGKITGFYTGGRGAEFNPVLEQVYAPIAPMGRLKMLKR